MKLRIIAFIAVALSMTGCLSDSQNTKVAKMVDEQQTVFSVGQPIPKFDWSLERDLVIKLYEIRNHRVVTHSVWRSDYGMIEGDCLSVGYGIPYDTSLTNPLRSTAEDEFGTRRAALTSVEQPEPNGIFASKNTNATWIMCAGEFGEINPIYTEAKVTGYPYPVKVDYDNNRVTKAGKATVVISN